MSGLMDMIFKGPPEQKMPDTSKTEAALAKQEASAAATAKSQQETLNARRRARMGRSGRPLLLQGAETGVEGSPVLASTLGG